MLTVDSEVCGLSSVTGTLFLGRHAAVEFSTFQILGPPQTKFHSPQLYWGGGNKDLKQVA